MFVYPTLSEDSDGSASWRLECTPNFVVFTGGSVRVPGLRTLVPQPSRDKGASETYLTGELEGSKTPTAARTLSGPNVDVPRVETDITIRYDII